MSNQISIKLGDKLPKFNLLAVDGKNYSQASFSSSKVLVVMFTCNHCPYVQAYEDRLIKLQEEYKNKGVIFIAVNSNDEKNYPEDSYENMIKRAEYKKYNFLYLRDKTQEVARIFGATYTPEVFVFDQNRALKYHGRIDDNWKEPGKVTRQDLKETIELLLQDKPVDFAETQAIGCTVKWSN